METAIAGSLSNPVLCETYTVVDKEMWNSATFSASTRQVYNGFGTTNHMSVSGQSVKHDRIYLQDDRGNLHDVELTDWNIGIAKGHRISIVWPAGINPDDKPRPLLGVWVTVKENHRMGNVLAIKNHSTGKSLYNEMLMRAMTRNPWFIAIPVAAVLIFLIIRQWIVNDAGLGSFFMALLFGTLIWQKTWNPMKYNTLKENINQHLH